MPWIGIDRVKHWLGSNSLYNQDPLAVLGGVNKLAKRVFPPSLNLFEKLIRLYLKKRKKRVKKARRTRKRKK